MSELDKKIQDIVKGMQSNKRSLIKRYGNKAEDVMYDVARKAAKKELNMTENNMGNEGEEYQITQTKSGEFPNFYIEKPDGSQMIDMFFDSEEEANKYATKRGMIIIPGGKRLNEVTCECPKLKKAIKEAYKNVSKRINENVDSKSYIENLNEVRELGKTSKSFYIKSIIVNTLMRSNPEGDYKKLKKVASMLWRDPYIILPQISLSTIEALVQDLNDWSQGEHRIQATQTGNQTIRVDFTTNDNLNEKHHQISEMKQKWVVYDVKSKKRLPNAGKTWATLKAAQAFADKQENAETASDEFYFDKIQKK